MSTHDIRFDNVLFAGFVGLSMLVFFLLDFKHQAQLLKQIASPSSN